MHYLPLFLALTFVLLIGGRAVLLQRRGIRAFVFARTDKSDFLLLPFPILFAYNLGAQTFGWPLWPLLGKPLYSGGVFFWLGVLLCLLAIIGIAVSLASFGASFRIGIDDQKPDKLVTSGMFAISRNPVYVCFLLFFTGMLLIYPNLLMVIVAVVFILAIHRQVLREEAFLKTYYGAEYLAYCHKVRRYI